MSSIAVTTLAESQEETIKTLKEAASGLHHPQPHLNGDAAGTTNGNNGVHDDGHDEVDGGRHSHLAKVADNDVVPTTEDNNKEAPVEKDEDVSQKVEVTPEVEVPKVEVTPEVETPKVEVTPEVETPNVEVTPEVETPNVEVASEVEIVPTVEVTPEVETPKVEVTPEVEVIPKVEVTPEEDSPVPAARHHQHHEVDPSLEEYVVVVRELRQGWQAKRQSSLEKRREVEAMSRPTISKAAMSTIVDEASVRAAYEDVRSDTTDTEWAVFKFQDQNILCSATGVGFDSFREHFADNDRAFGFIRIQMGDEMSKRQKFMFLTWVGPQVSVIKRAKMNIDKAMVKNIVKNFAVELQVETQAEINADYFRDQLARVGGANYGTGFRD